MPAYLSIGEAAVAEPCLQVYPKLTLARGYYQGILAPTALLATGAGKLPTQTSDFPSPETHLRWKPPENAMRPPPQSKGQAEAAAIEPTRQRDIALASNPHELRAVQ